MPCSHRRPTRNPPTPPQFYNVERKWRRKLEGAMDADRAVSNLQDCPEGLSATFRTVQQ